MSFDVVAECSRTDAASLERVFVVVSADVEAAFGTLGAEWFAESKMDPYFLGSNALVL